ncbi:hypothetical protein AU210_012079 [Fusarium oxysporum f. sp. radicis-cucumerinum]|uniref:Uncharacterized protein n=1 Tax=Fusarium oxysporum f. sp. radicis-cucumerinum TaxID=327505 RepID=A0A2H3GVK0_FUSOX|nr:hypothetical protein AU210_012079 [Fusarium oxysporum f. sp. radicis-cucumerinum]
MIEEQLYHGYKSLAGCSDEDALVGGIFFYLGTMLKKDQHNLVSTKPSRFPECRKLTLHISTMVKEKSDRLFAITLNCICQRGIKIVFGIDPFRSASGSMERNSASFFPVSLKPRDNTEIRRHVESPRGTILGICPVFPYFRRLLEEWPTNVE